MGAVVVKYRSGKIRSMPVVKYSSDEAVRDRKLRICPSALDSFLIVFFLLLEVQVVVSVCSVVFGIQKKCSLATTT